MRGRHGGYASQAKRRGEDYLGCNTCGQPHGRLIFPQAAPDERITPWRLLGLVMFGLAMWATLLYAVPIVLIGLSGGAS